jgi:hypothetical protein
VLLLFSILAVWGEI